MKPVKPEWKDAPDWAQYLAQDEDGTWVFFEQEPFKWAAGEWRSNGQKKRHSYLSEQWEQSLEKRP